MTKSGCVMIWISGAVFFLCLVMPVSKVYALAESTGPGGSNVQALHQLGLTGEGINVAVIGQANTRVTHEAFKDTNGISHASWYDFTDQNDYEPISHDTWVAGVAASRGGASYPDDKGAAPGADIYSAKITRPVSPTDPNRVVALTWIDDALDTLINQHSCRVVVSGIAFSVGPQTTPNGQSEYTLLYDYYAYEENVIFANAAGNVPSRITVFGDAYNGITTGGLILTDANDEQSYLKIGSLTASGTTDDGRRKPDIVAPSQMQTMPSGGTWYTWTAAGGETSLSAPHIAGVAAVLLQYADSTTTQDDDGHNEVIKAVIVNSTFPNILDRSGLPTNPADSNNVWHEDRGYGRIDALRAYQLLGSPRIVPGDVNQPKGWAYETMTNKNQTDTYSIEGQKNDRLVLTVTWNRKPTREWISSQQRWGYSDETSQKFNVNLTIKNSNGVILFSESESLNNLEKVDILLPDDDTYEVKLKNPGTKRNRSYALAFELLPPIPGDFDVNYIVNYDDLDRIANEWLMIGIGLDEDLWPDGSNSINFGDFAVFASYWQDFDPAYYDQL